MDIPQELRFKTRSGADVIIEDIRSEDVTRPILGKVLKQNGLWYNYSWYRNGQFLLDEESDYDIDFDQTDIVKIQ